MLRVMEKLEIDAGMRELIGKLWRHCYNTEYSCDGHGRKEAYITFKKSGDGWFEENAQKYGLVKRKNGSCCERQKEGNFCGLCGAGMNGNVAYSGLPRQYNY